MRIEDRVRLAFDLGLNKEFQPMLALALPAIEATSKKKFGVGGRNSFIKFVRKHYDVIGWFVGGGINFKSLKFSTLEPSLTDGKTIERPDLGSGLIDHIQKMTMAAMAIADMKVCAHRS